MALDLTSTSVRPSFYSMGGAYKTLDEKYWKCPTNTLLRGAFYHCYGYNELTFIYPQIEGGGSLEPFSGGHTYYYYFLTRNEGLEDARVNMTYSGGVSPNEDIFDFHQQPIVTDIITFDNVDYALFYIPEGQYNFNMFGPKNAIQFTGFDWDIIYCGISQTSGGNFNSIQSTTKSRLNANNWTAYNSFQELKGSSVQQTKDNAYNDGYQSGADYNLTNPDSGVWSLIGGGFNAVGGFLQTPVFPNISIGGLLAIPLMGLLLFFLLKMIKGNG